MKQKIEAIISKIKKKHADDPTINDDLDVITAMLSKNANSTITTLYELDEEEIDWICGLFPEISAALKSQSFLNCISSLKSKFPSLDMDHWIEAAKQAK